MRGLVKFVDDGVVRFVGGVVGEMVETSRQIFLGLAGFAELAGLGFCLGFYMFFYMDYGGCVGVRS